jgi:hypothetical protein
MVLNLHVDYLSSCLLALFLAYMAVLCQANAVWAQEVVASCCSSSPASSHCIWASGSHWILPRNNKHTLYYIYFTFNSLWCGSQRKYLVYFSSVPAVTRLDSFPSGHYHISGHNHTVASRRRDLTCTDGLACLNLPRKEQILVIFNIGVQEVLTFTCKCKMLIKIIITIMFRWWSLIGYLNRVGVKCSGFSE